MEFTTSKTEMNRRKKAYLTMVSFMVAPLMKGVPQLRLSPRMRWTQVSAGIRTRIELALYLHFSHFIYTNRSLA